MNNTKILIVDDQASNIKAMSSSIQELDIDVDIISADSGNMALSLLLDHKFALVMLDVQMPGMDGFEVAELMRSHADTSKIPIIFVTAGAVDQKQMFKGYEAGAVDFLNKPYDPHVLASKVKIFVELDQQKQIQDEYIQKIQEQSETMKKLKDTAEAASRAKTDFLANISHEIRTPLGSILGFSKLLKTKNPNYKEREEYIEIIDRSGKVLLGIINDVLDLSKIEAGRIDVEKVNFILKDLLKDIENLFQLKASDKGLKLNLSMKEGTPTRITSDPIRFKQILTNLLTNAIKFTKKGTVKVVVSFDQVGTTKEPLLRVDVIDSGIGIDAEVESKLFNAFTQADSSITRRFGGTGLGLKISRQLAEALGGDLKLLASNPGKGSTFSARINPHPFSMDKIITSKTEKVEEKNLHSTQGKLMGVDVLYVDDGVENRRLVEITLTQLGANITTANDGKEGIEKVESGNFDIVLMDIQMPVMDGFEAVEILRKSNFNKPIIALTAFAFSEEKERFLKSGFSDHVSKPIDITELAEKISFHISNTPVRYKEH